ncbi:MAG: type II toxin-antitoxin system death-on-curing family toxin [Clostridia bacterium]|nr:type II toxin-antitoxin system death-on-curing family toxin [Clostridia bacterium]
MILLTVDEIIELHSKLIAKTGGSAGLRDPGLLQSAVYSAESSFDDTELYPTVPEKSARLMFALTSNHAFVDGNKRIGVFVMLLTLKLNGISLSYTQTELIELGLNTASGKFKYENILTWIQDHSNCNP